MQFIGKTIHLFDYNLFLYLLKYIPLTLVDKFKNMSILLQATTKITPKVVEIPFRETLSYDLLLAVITGIISSIIFFAILRIFRPRIKTCNIIAKKAITKENGETRYEYYFKFINNTYSDIENVSIELLLMEDYFHGSNKNFTSKSLKVARPEFKFLKGRASRDKTIFNNCIQMNIDEDLETIWNGDREWLQLQIDSTHSKSGRRKVHVQVFKDPSNTIKLGKFDSGENFSIMNS
jgi:hypothetical protein